MKVGVANKGGVFDALPHLLSSLPDVSAEHFQPFGSYDVTVGVDYGGARKIDFSPEQERLESLKYPVTIGYSEKLPLRLDRVVCSSAPSLIRRYESLVARVGRLVVDPSIYAETRSLLHHSIAVESAPSASGIRLILGSDYQSKTEMLTAMVQGQPFLAVDSEASESVIRAVRCPYPWMIPFTGIMDGSSKIEMIMIKENLASDLEEVRKKCLAERLHSRFLHLWAEVLLG